MTTTQADRFNGVSLVVPYLALSEKDQALMDKYKSIANIVNMIAPTYKFNIRKGRALKKWILNFADDPLYVGGSICCHNIVNSER